MMVNQKHILKYCSCPRLNFSVLNLSLINHDFFHIFDTPLMFASNPY